MTAPTDDEPVFGFGAPAAEAWIQDWAERPDADDSRAGAHAQPVEIEHVETARPPYADRRRYFLSSFEPSGDFDAVIVAVTDGTRRRYFTTHDGSGFTEIDVASFDRRNEGGERSLLELDERELGELEAELEFVRPVRGRDPIAEVRDAAAEVAQAQAGSDGPSEAVPAATDGAPKPLPAPATVPAAPAATPAAPAATPAAPETPADAPPHPEEMPTMPDAIDPATHDPRIDASTSVDPVTEELEEMVLAARRSTFREASDAASDQPADDDQPAGEAQRAGGAEPDADEESLPIAASEPIPTHAHAPRPPAQVGPRTWSQTEAVEQVALARGIAFIAHRGQLDRSGLPYVDHPGRIAERFDPVTEPVEAAAAWLHDVLEDTAITAEELFEAGVVPEVIEIVRLLTRTKDVAPEEYYARIRSHPAARRVKLADIDDNTARWRLRRLDYDVQLRLIEKYRVARRALGSH